MSKSVSIAILISGQGSNLQAIIDQVALEQLDVDIRVVVSNRPAVAGLLRAQSAGIPTEVVDHTVYPSREAFDRALLTVLSRYDVEWVILAGFMRRLTAECVAAYKGKMLNVHPALLPKHRGLHTHERVLACGDRWHGTSIHCVTAALDAGPLICQGRFAVEPSDTVATLTQKVQQLEHYLYPEVLKFVACRQLVCADDKVVLNGHKIPSEGLDLTPDFIK